jgi:hypothetical protein
MDDDSILRPPELAGLGGERILPLRRLAIVLNLGGTGLAQINDRLATMKKRLRRSLKRVAEWCRTHRHYPADWQQATLNAKLRGHYQYYGRPTNYRSLWQFYRGARQVWKKWLSRRTNGRDAVTPRNRKGEATGNTNLDLNRRASLRPYF